MICHTGVLSSRRRSYVVPPRPMLGWLVPRVAHPPLALCIRYDSHANRKQHPTYTLESNFLFGACGNPVPAAFPVRSACVVTRGAPVRNGTFVLFCRRRLTCGNAPDLS